MHVARKEHLVSDRLLWQRDTTELPDDIFFQQDENTMMFGIFYLDDVLEDNEQVILKSYLQDLIYILEPWNTAYPWNFCNGVMIQLRQYMTGEYYIFGSIQVGDNAREEESIILSLLLQFSKHAGPCAFIKVCDSDGEFMLMEANEVIPDQLEFPVSNNRIWINNGRIQHIPTSYYFNRGLTKLEAVSYLKKSSSKLSLLPAVERQLESSFLHGFPLAVLDKLKACSIPINDPKIASIVRNSPKVVAYAICHFMTSTFQSDDLSRNPIRTDDTQMVDVIIPSSHLRLLKKFADLTNSSQENTSKDPNYLQTLGMVIECAIDDLLKEDLLYVTEVSEVQKKSLTTLLQERGDITDYLTAYVDWNTLVIGDDSGTDATTLDSLKQSLLQFLQEDSDLSGVNNRQEKHKTESAEPSDEYLEEDETRSIRSDATIDEDDFFEFFLKNALKMPDDDIEQLRSFSSNLNQCKEHASEDNAAVEDMQKSFTELLNDEMSIKDLASSLTVDGAPLGPVRTIIESWKGR